jgi:DNA-binding PadR family transcriptional regulator
MCILKVIHRGVSFTANEIAVRLENVYGNNFHPSIYKHLEDLVKEGLLLQDVRFTGYVTVRVYSLA